MDTELVTVDAVTVNRQRVVLVPGSQPQGCLNFHWVAANGANPKSVKASPGNLYGWRIFNNADYPIYVKLHNTAGVPNPGAGVVFTIAVQAGTLDADSISFGMAFSIGIGMTIVQGIADSDNTGVLANDCVVDLLYA